MVRRAFGLTVATATLLVSTSAPKASAPPPKEAFIEGAKARFYFIAEESFTSVHCAIEVDAIDRLLADVRSNLAAAMVPATLVEDTEAFSLTFLRAREEVRFIEPTMKIIAHPDAQEGDTERLQHGSVAVEAGYKAAVIGAMQIVRGVFKELSLSRFDGYSDLAFSPQAEGYRASYVDGGGARVEERFEGTVRTIRALKDGQRLSGTSRYVKEGERGYLLSSVELATGPGVSAAISLTYQRVQGVLIPQSLVVRSRQLQGGVPHESRVHVSLTRCNVSP